MLFRSGGDEELKQLIKEKKFLFGGRALTNRGTDNSGSMFNCYSSGFAPDDYTELLELNKNLGLTYKAQGGQGVSMSKLRPKGTVIGTRFKSDGIIPFMEIFNTTTKETSQGGSRKGALMISLDIRHKEERLQFQVEAQEVCASINVYDFKDDIAIYNDVVVTYDTSDETYSFTHQSEKFLINVVLKYKLEDSTNKLKIIKWQLKEI